MNKEEARTFLLSSGLSDRQIDVIEQAFSEPCEDAISRQAVLDKILKFSVTDGRSVSVAGLWTEVNELPLVTPQEPCDVPDINVGDMISRQAVLDIVDSYSESQSNVEDVTQDIISDIVVLPPVNPQAKTGNWIVDRDDSRRWDKVRFYCSECGSWQTYGKTDYCPNCGAKMVESQERSEKE